MIEKSILKTLATATIAANAMKHSRIFVNFSLNWIENQTLQSKTRSLFKCSRLLNPKSFLCQFNWEHLVSKRKARDSNPHITNVKNGLAVRSGNPYPATFQLDYSRLFIVYLLSGPPGNRTPISCMQNKCLTTRRAAHKKVSLSASSILTDDAPLQTNAKAAHGRVKPFIIFTPVVGVSTAQQQAVVQRAF